MAVDWEYYSDEAFQRVEDVFLPASGEGDNRATQIVTAVTKLVYKWYNDGDVYDNTGMLEGWANDLSSYANWLYKYVPRLRNILDGIFDCFSDSDYEDLLKRLADASVHDMEDIERYASKPKIGSIYDCDGPFEFREDLGDEEEEMWEDEEEEEY